MRSASLPVRCNSGAVKTGFLILTPIFLTAILLSVAASSSFAETQFLPASSTPYDHQMARIRPILTTSTSAAPARISLKVVNQWMENLHSIPYGFTATWKTPAEMQTEASADCKAKALALYEKMVANGATDVQLIIGKRAFTDERAHAWLAWATDDGLYILDPTFNRSARTIDQAGKENYRPLFAYSGNKKFRASAESKNMHQFLPVPGLAVAQGGRSPTTNAVVSSAEAPPPSLHRWWHPAREEFMKALEARRAAARREAENERKRAD